MPKKDLGTLLANIKRDEPDTTPAEADAAAAPALAVSAPRPARATTPARSRQAVGEGSTNSEPHYLQLTRKEARFRDEQIADLTQLSRRLNRSKDPAATERITENTLIRVAVDLLLAQADRLSGSTESELRQSVSL